MATIETKDRIEEELTDEEIINYRLRKTTRQIELKHQKDIKQKKYYLDPYFDSIKNWRPN